MVDRALPAAGLDANGRRILDLGTRHLEMFMDERLQLIRDENRQEYVKFPKVYSTDDPARAEAARALFERQKPVLAGAIETQTRRLNAAMSNLYRWSVTAFQEDLVEHPLTFLLVRQVIFGLYNGSGDLSETFRVGEDRSFWSHAEEPVIPEPDAQIGVVHPIEMAADLPLKWQHAQSEAMLVPLFLQMDVPVYRLKPENVASAHITEFAGEKRQCGSMTRPLYDDYGFRQLGRYVQAADTWVICRCLHDPKAMFQDRIEEIYFVHGTVKSRESVIEKGLDERERIPLGEVHPVLFSEAMRMANNLLIDAITYWDKKK